MRRAGLWVLVAMVFAVGVAVQPAVAQSQRIGFGAHYWVTVDDVEVDNIDEDGLSYLVSYQFGADTMTKFELGLEVFPDGFAGTTETTYAPQAFLLFGSALYGGVGVGINYADGDFADDPFYALRAGLDLELAPSLFLDINGNYQFLEWDSKAFDNIDTDTVTLGASLRIGF